MEPLYDPQALQGAVAAQGLAALFLASFLACLALPIPVSLLMLAAGALAASGDMGLAGVVLAVLAGAVLGDQAGYALGRLGGARLWDRLEARPRAGPLLVRARSALLARAALTVFFSRWLISPLGPYVNFAAGATRLTWARFTWPATLGKALWVCLYVGLGYLFGARVEAMGASVAPVLIGVAAIIAATLVVRMLIRRRAG